MVCTDTEVFVLLLPAHCLRVCSHLYTQQQLLQQGQF